MQSSQLKYRRIYACIVGISIVALLCTFSRSAWIVTSFHLMIVLICASKIYIKKIPLTVRSMGMGVVCALLIASVMVFPSITDESVVRRVELQRAAFRMWQHSPIFGIGLGNFISQLPSYTHSRYIDFLQPAHNIYILLFSEVGVVGFLLIILAGGFVLYRLIAVFSRATVERRLVYITRWTPMLCLVILGGIDHYLMTLQQGQLLVTVCSGLCVASFSDR